MQPTSRGRWAVLPARRPQPFYPWNIARLCHATQPPLKWPPPLQCGLSGSSALACATLNCLLRHYQQEAAVPVADRPQLVLDAELALGVTGGLQDRVIQVTWTQVATCPPTLLLSGMCG